MCPPDTSSPDFGRAMIRPCFFCGSSSTDRQPCVAFHDRCATCLERRAATHPGRLVRLLAELGLAPPTPPGLARLTVRVDRSRRGSIGAASVGCGGDKE
jgi:hypothetical protein